MPLFRPNPSSGVPIYLQLIEQVKHAIGTGALRPGEQLPPIRKMAEDLVINANTVARAYRELETAGVIELRQGSGAFVAAGAVDGGRLRDAVPIVAEAIERLRAIGLAEDEIRRLVEAELSALRESARRR
jgi:GntR family transcriptional regulator